jgi:DNA-binding transcriptional ArsR family regulator
VRQQGSHMSYNTVIQDHRTIELSQGRVYIRLMQRPFVHPAIEDVTLEAVLYALADPARLEIVKKLAGGGACGMNCQTAAPALMPKSTQSHHFQILREAGLIRSERRGTEVVNSIRCAEVEKRFPGVISAILKASDKAKKR